MPILQPLLAPFGGGAQLPPAPSVPYFPAGYMPTTADLDAWIYDNFWFLTRRPVFRARQAVNTQSFASPAPITLHFDAIDEDPWQGWSASAYGWTPKIDGFYHITVTGRMATPGAAGTLEAGVAVNGQTPPEVSGSNVSLAEGQGTEGSFLAYLIAGEDVLTATLAYLSPGTYPGGSTSKVAGQQSSIEVVWASL